MELSFEDFKYRAKNKSLSKWEKIGFPDSYRKDTEVKIFDDICNKLKLENCESILDIGCGCSDLVNHLINFCNRKQKQLHLIDSQEMLSNLDFKSSGDFINLIPGRFPESDVLTKLQNIKFDGIIVYSVLQYVFLEQSIFSFIHECVNLLNPGGILLIGDIPNFQKRQRFLGSEEGRIFVEKRINDADSVKIIHDNFERIDDGVLISILLRFRNFGYETYLLPQLDGLPFSNRREDILIVRR